MRWMSIWLLVNYPTLMLCGWGEVVFGCLTNDLQIGILWMQSNACIPANDNKERKAEDCNAMHKLPEATLQVHMHC